MTATQTSTSKTQGNFDSTESRLPAIATASSEGSVTNRRQTTEKKMNSAETHTAKSTSSMQEDNAAELHDSQPQFAELPVIDSEPNDDSSVGSEEVPTVPAVKIKCDLPDNSESSIETETDEKPPVSLTPEFMADYAKEQGVRCFRNQHGSHFASVPVARPDGTHFECHQSRSRTFLARLLDLIKIRSKSTPKLSKLKRAIEIMELDAYRFPVINLENRRATKNGETLMDIGDPNWNMIRVTSRNWEVTSQVEPAFFRPQHAQPLPIPERGGNFNDLFEFLPVETPEEKLLLTAWLLGALHASIPNPILLFVGQQGSAKTTRTRRLRSLLDPSVTPVLGEMEMSNLFLTFQHHAIPCFENVSQFKRREADMFCRAVTGNGVERRKLYTDSDQVLYSFRRSIIINGIDTPSMRPDFLDRCLIIHCKRMEDFRTLQELDRQFEAARPKILGAMLDHLVSTLNQLPSTPAAAEFRMADFAHFGRAVAIALGQPSTDFDEAYRLNIRQRNFEVLEDAPMTQVLKEFAKGYSAIKPWNGSAIALLDALRTAATNAGDLAGMKDLPKSARWLSSRLAEMTSALKTIGIVVKKLQRTNDQRGWQVFTDSSLTKR